VLGINLDVAPGEVVAVLGPNGAGKTTTIEMLLGLRSPSRGVVSVFGKPPRHVEALFSFGGELATERSTGWLRRLRATPMPMWVYFAGKVALNLVFTLVSLLGMAAVAVVVGHVTFDPSRLIATTTILLTGVIAFSTMGSAIAYWVRPRAVSTIVNLVFLPLSFLSGFFFPIDQLPDLFAKVAQVLPTYHFGQLAWGVMAPAQDVASFGNPPSGTAAGHLAVVLVWFVGCGVLIVLGYRRELDRERQ
jgi:ABC-2 type transport system permease protein